MSGLNISYRWQASTGADGGQCQFPGEYTIPISSWQLSSIIMDDTDALPADAAFAAQRTPGRTVAFRTTVHYQDLGG